MKLSIFILTLHVQIILQILDKGTHAKFRIGFLDLKALDGLQSSIWGVDQRRGLLGGGVWLLWLSLLRSPMHTSPLC
jgi:hypothetical protein